MRIAVPWPVRWKHLNISWCQPYQVTQWSLCRGQVHCSSCVLMSAANQNRVWRLTDQSESRDHLCLMSASIINDGRYSLKPTILQQSKHIDNWPAFLFPLPLGSLDIGDWTKDFLHQGCFEETKLLGRSLKCFSLWPTSISYKQFNVYTPSNMFENVSMWFLCSILIKICYYNRKKIMLLL